MLYTGLLMQPRFSAVWISLIALGLSMLAAGACGSAPDDGGVHVLTAEGAVNPVLANYIERGISQAEDSGASAVVIRLDTPGGLDSSMREIIKAINNSPVPVIVYVAPSGGRAASAGTFITMAGHVAAMAPNTAIGAAHPVDSAGGDIEGNLGKKIENDAVAYIRGIAENRGRNADWAEQAVRESVSANENEAVELNVIDLVAPSTERLLELVDGRTVRLQNQTSVRLATAGQPLRDNDMTLIEQFLMLISDPNIAFLLLSLGSLGILLELFNPGSMVPGVVGVLALTVAFFSLGTLPVNWAGVILIFLAFALFALEIFIAGFGALGIGGVVALALGGFILTTGDNPQFEVSPWLSLGLPAAIGALLALFVLYVFNGRHRPIAIGAETLVGAVASARTPLTPEGFVLLHGERWKATASEAVAEGERVIVTGVEGLHLSVRPAEPEEKH